MLRRLLDKLQGVGPQVDPSPLPPPRTYADLFDMMRYDRSMDLMPYAIGLRPRPPLIDPSGPEPTFVLLDTDAEVKAFMATFNEPIEFDRPGVISWEPLLRWNDTPSALMADTVLVSFAYPDDETQGWPFLQLFAVPPAMFMAGKIRPQDTVRGRYNFRQFSPEEKERYVRELSDARAQAGGVDVFIGGKMPISMVEMLNSRKSGDDQ